MKSVLKDRITQSYEIIRSNNSKNMSSKKNYLLDILFKKRNINIIIKNILCYKDTYGKYYLDSSINNKGLLLWLIDNLISITNNDTIEYDLYKPEILNGVKETDIAIYNEMIRFDIFSLKEIITIISLSENTNWIIRLLEFIRLKWIEPYSIINNSIKEGNIFLNVFIYFIENDINKKNISYSWDVFNCIIRLLNLENTQLNFNILNNNDLLDDLLKIVSDKKDKELLILKIDELKNWKQDKLLLGETENTTFNSFYENIDSLDIYDESNIEKINSFIGRKKLIINEWYFHELSLQEADNDENKQIAKLESIFNKYIVDTNMYLLLVEKTKCYFSKHLIYILSLWLEINDYKEIVDKVKYIYNNSNNLEWLRLWNYYKYSYDNNKENCWDIDNYIKQPLFLQYNNINNINVNTLSFVERINNNYFNNSLTLEYYSYYISKCWGNIIDDENAFHIVSILIDKEEIRNKNDLLFSEIKNDNIKNKLFTINNETYETNYWNSLNPIYEKNNYIDYHLWYHKINKDLSYYYFWFIFTDFIDRYVKTWKISSFEFNDLLLNFLLLDSKHYMSKTDTSYIVKKDILDEFLLKFDNEFTDEEFEEYLELFKSFEYCWYMALYYFKKSPKWKVLSELWNDDLLLDFLKNM